MLSKTATSATMVIIGYFASWSIYQRNFHVSDIPSQRYSHIIYAFVGISAENTVELIDSFADIGASDGNWAFHSKEKVQKGNLFHLQQFKLKNPTVSIGVSIGGQSHSHRFGQMISSVESRKQFIDSLVEFLLAFQFDFVDVDFEFPSNDVQAKNLLLFMEELHSSVLKEGMFITMAIPTTAYHLQHFKLEEMQQFVRFFNVMAYGYGEYWRETVEFNAPLYADGICIDATVEYLVDKRGILPSKLVLGIPAYCVAFASCTKMHEVHKGPFTGFGDAGMLDYKELEKHILDASKTEINLKNATAFTVCSKNALITHETPETVKEKWEYLQKRGLGGIMIWHIAADSAQKSLFSAIEVLVEVREQSASDAGQKSDGDLHGRENVQVVDLIADQEANDCVSADQEANDCVSADQEANDCVSAVQEANDCVSAVQETNEDLSALEETNDNLLADQETKDSLLAAQDHPTLVQETNDDRTGAKELVANTELIN